MIYNIRPIVLSAGIQNIVHTGLVYPLNILSSLYLIFTSKIRIKTTLDAIMALYIAAGILSFVGNIIPNLVLDVNIAIHSIKSFLIFMTIMVYYSGSRYSPAEFYKACMLIIVPISIGILIHSLYLITIGGISWYTARSMVMWASGWPQRWVVFVMVGFFYCLSAMQGKIIPKILALIFLSLIILSGTRSALLGLAAGYLVFSLYSRRVGSIVTSLSFVFLCGLVFWTYAHELTDLFRVYEVATVLEGGPVALGGESSIGYRLIELWPVVFKSVFNERFFLGWGHVGISYLPEEILQGTAILAGAASAESQYIDVLQRQGVIGLFLFMAILIHGIYLSHRVSKKAKGARSHGFWIGSIAWQVAVLVHGVTVETVRYPVYSLFYFVYLGMLTYQHRTLGNKSRRKTG